VSSVDFGGVGFAGVGALLDGCERGPDTGPKLDMRDILTAGYLSRQAHIANEIRARERRL